MPAVVWLNVRVRLSQQFILFDWSICLIRMKFCMKIPFYVLFLIIVKNLLIQSLLLSFLYFQPHSVIE